LFSSSINFSIKISKVPIFFSDFELCKVLQLEFLFSEIILFLSSLTCSIDFNLKFS
jgi:hypothetical protein